MASSIDNRYEFVYLFDVENGNPNGDPDAGNLPRVDPETNYGLVTDVCLKRKIRNYVELVKSQKPGHQIYVREKAVLNDEHKRAYTDAKLVPEPKKLPKDKEKARQLTGWMCSNFFDIRTFGAVMTTEINCGQVRGPVQINFARSLDSIVPLEISITRMAVTNEKDLEKERTMGRKHIVPYALYRSEGYISASLANQTGFSEEDLKLLWEALENMFEHDRSAARGKMSARGLYVFKHESALGNAQAQRLFDLIDIKRSGDPEKPPRAFTDYVVSVNASGVPKGVTLEEKI